MCSSSKPPVAQQSIQTRRKCWWQPACRATPLNALLSLTYQVHYILGLLLVLFVLWPFGGNPRFWLIRSAWDQGAWWTLPAASFVTRVRVEGPGPRGIRSAWEGLVIVLICETLSQVCIVTLVALSCGSPDLQKNSCNTTAVWLVEAGRSAGLFVFEKRHRNTSRSRVTARADFKPIKGLGLGLGL